MVVWGELRAPDGPSQGPAVFPPKEPPPVGGQLGAVGLVRGSGVFLILLGGG